MSATDDTARQARLASLRKQLDGPRDGALLRYSLALAWRDAGQLPQAIDELQAATRFDADYSAAWKLLGRLQLEAGATGAAAAAWQAGIEAARRRGDKQAEKEMGVFLRRLQR